MKSLRNYANYSQDDFCRDLSFVDWNVSTIDGQSESVDALWDHFKTSFVSVADKHAPIIQKRVRGVDVCPWLNKSIKVIMRRRDFLLKKARKTKNSEDWTNYRSCRNKVTDSIRKAKASYNHRLIKECGNDHKAFWKTMKRILPGEKSAVSTKINTGHSIIADKRLIANAFNKFFVGTASRLLEKLPSLPSFSTVPQDVNSGPELQRTAFKFEDVSEDFVKNQLRGLKAGKAVGLDKIPARLLIDAADIVVRPLTDIINCSLRSGTVPLDLKSARVIPLFKKGKMDDMDNYRPISILPTVSKLLERAVHTQFYQYLREHNILSPYQCGFRKCHSTEFAALSFADTVRRNMDQGMLTGAVFIDFRKAFDTVNHDLLIQKLSSLGVLDKELAWFNDYLKDRIQVLDFQGVSSDPETIGCGVPQGSILGPLLFILHVNDLPNVVNRCSVLMYADDTVLYYAAPNVETLQEMLNKELRSIERWLFRNSLFLNVTKTEAMVFGTFPRLSNIESFNISVNGSPINRVYQFKYLGVVFDENLSWNDHVKYVLAKAGKRVGMLGRLRYCITGHSANIIYTSMIRPIIEYCNTVWGCCGEVNKAALERLQRRAGRIVCRVSSSDSALTKLKWETLANRHSKNTFKLVKNVLRGIVLSSLRAILNLIRISIHGILDRKTLFICLL